MLNNRGYLSESTRTKVHEAMRELGYRPNAIARSLQGQRSQMVGLIFPTVANPSTGRWCTASKVTFRRSELPGHSLQ